MKTNSRSAERSSLPREFGIIDTLVLMLAVALFAAWILGTFFLYFFPAGASASANPEIAALAVNDDRPSGVSAANGTQGSDDGTGAANDTGDSQASNAAGSNSNQIQASGGLAAEAKSELEQKISKLEEQLEAKSEELTELRKTSKESAKPDREAAADASRYKSQISQLTKQKDRLDRDIKKLKDESKIQKTKIQTLQDELATAAKAVPMAGAINAEENLTGLRDATPQDQPLEFRDWISSKGNKARLAFVRWEDDEIVVINKDNKTFRLTINRLSPADQKYVNSKR